MRTWNGRSVVAKEVERARIRAITEEVFPRAGDDGV
jgi:hypothetical protein